MNNSRWLLLPAILGFGLGLSACSGGSKVIADVGSTTITVSEFKERAQKIPKFSGSDKDYKKMVLDFMINEQILNTMAQKSGLDRMQYINQLKKKELAVTEAEVASYRSSHPEKFIKIPAKNTRSAAIAYVQKAKFDAWLTKVTSTLIPVKINQSVLDSVKIPKK